MNKRRDIWKLCLVGLLASVAVCSPVVWELLAGPSDQITDMSPPILE